VPPKYLQVFSDPARTPIFLGNGPIRPGRPLVVTEGEFDALVLSQALGEAASVVTLGSASARPSTQAFLKMLVAPTWYIATDADQAGETAVNGWPDRARRVRPPGSFKDWTEAAGGVDLARWWGEVFAGIEAPEFLTREELARWRPGDADGEEGDDAAGRPGLAKGLEDFDEWAAPNDVYEPERHQEVGQPSRPAGWSDHGLFEVRPGVWERPGEEVDWDNV
jgi:hypothetical protein